MRLVAIPILVLFCAIPLHADPQKAARLNAEGAQAAAREDWATAEQKFTEALAEGVPAPYDVVVMGNRGVARAKLGRSTQALEELGRAMEEIERRHIANKQDFLDWLQFRCKIFTQIGRWQECVDACDALLRDFPGDPLAVTLRAWALAHVGRVDESAAELKAWMAKDRTVAAYLVGTQKLQGDLEGVVATSMTETSDPLVRNNLLLARTMALCDLGRLDEALKAVRVLQDLPYTVDIPMAQAYIMSTPGYFKYNIEEAGKTYDDFDSKTDYVPAVAHRARMLFLSEQYAACRDYLTTRGPRTDFTCLFWLGAAQWKLEQFAEARATLTDARRLNPYLAAWAKRIPGMDEFVAPIDEEITVEKGGSSGRKLQYELATHLLSVAEIEALVRRYLFARAAGEYGKLLPSLVSPIRRREVETRLGQVKGMAAALDKLVLAINARKVKLSVKVAGQELTIVKADDRGFDFTIPKGSGRFPWAYLDPLDFFRFANPHATTSEERFALGVLLWDVGEAKAAQQNLENAARGAAGLRSSIDALVARRRGIATPKGGFVSYKGAYVTPEEKANLEKGLVRYQGEWVTPADRDKMSKGLIRIGGKWVDGDEKKLLAAGYRKVDGKWMGAEDFEALRSKWETAFETETAHFRIRTNAGESFSKDLTALAEIAYGEMKTFYDGREPNLGKEKMTLYAFRSYDDYRRYCVERKAEEQLNAAGFAASDSNVVAGWDKTGNRFQLLQTMVHEAAHMYYFRICSPAALPSWHAEAMATYFEGFKGSGASWRFNYVSEARLAFAREAMLDKNQIPLTDLLAGDALKLINSDSTKANLFYSECWSLNYFLSQTDNAAYRDGYKAFRKAIETGKNAALSEFIPDLAGLEKAWVLFVTSQ